jgi:uncharacterized phage protein (TIGR01671 family)
MNNRIIKFRLFYCDQWGNKSVIYPKKEPDQNRFLIGLDGTVLENYGKSWKEPFWEAVFDASEPPKISRFTGLKDKNGKEIYEDDIIKTDSGIIGAVRYLESIAGYSLYSPYYPAYRYDMNLLDSYEPRNPDLKYPPNQDIRTYKIDSSKLEITGNIFENKELLKNE